MLATSLLIGAAALGAVYHAGRRRAGRLGFAVFGGGYFALAFLGFSEPNLNRLPTTWLLRYVHNKVVPTPINVVDALYIAAQPSGTTATVSNPVPVQMASRTTASPNRWKLMLPGAAKYDCFNVVEHCLSALLAGLLRIVTAREFQARQNSVRFDQ
jgi:hypothetical protein